MKPPYIDPVCHMRVESDKISTLHEGTLQVFCSTHCQQKFLANPAEYLQQGVTGAKQQSKRGCCG